MRLFKWVFYCLLLAGHQGEVFAGETCGSKAGFFQQIASEELIPDLFPPESPALRDMVSEVDRSRCERIAVVSYSEACSAHDECYDRGKSKISCDRALQDAWVKSCRMGYGKPSVDARLCRLSCEIFAKLMSEAQRFETKGFCPSCDAYNSVNKGEGR